MRVVQKYGGSSLKDVASIQQVAARVAATRRAGNDVVVVVSAMGNTTNELLALARQVAARPTTRELDLLVSVGERVSMTLLAMALEDRGLAAASFTGSQSGIITDDAHVRARVLEVRPHRIERALAEGKVAIVAGFQGVSRNGEVTTLGRGGSDTTAVVLCAALGADHCEICSDVDGIWTADPRVVADAQRHDVLSLDSAVALSQAGAKVLLAEAVERARELGVTLHAAATALPAGTGTRLPPGPVSNAPIGVAAAAPLEWLVVPSDGPWPAVPLHAAWSTGHETHLLLDSKDVPDRGALVLPPGTRALGDVTAVSVVGASFLRDTAARDRARTVAGATLWSWVAADRIAFVVPSAASADLQRALHAAMVG